MSRGSFVTQHRGEAAGGSPPHPHPRVKREPRSPPGDLADMFEQALARVKLEPASPAPAPGPRPSLSLSDLSALRELQPARGPQHARRARTPPLYARDRFVSMAEAIYHFQRDTPGRFHSHAPPAAPPAPGPAPALTVPHSPALRCRTRARPVRLPTREELEARELDEIRNHKIKANPVPKSVIHGSHLPDVVRRERTVPEPFNLTEVRKKPPPPEEEFVFAARPAPRHILEKPYMLKKLPTSTTIPISPKFTKIRAHSHENLRQPPEPAKKPVKKVTKGLQLFCSEEAEVPHVGVPVATHTEPARMEPFSFEKRDEAIRNRKEQKIKEMIKEEKKLASQFKANPVPKIIKKKMQELHSSKQSEVSTSSNEKENYKFEAKPPKVLSKKPFVPVLKSVQVTAPVPFQLTTVKRANEREEFDRQLKEKEEEMQRFKEQRERERHQAEERERAQLRAQLVHHAQPVPDIVPFIPEKSSAPLTEPQTPMFVRRIKKQ